MKRKESFWKYLNVEVQKAKDDEAGLILQMDGNLWAGNNIIKGDVKKQNQNGRYFERFLQENSHLNMVNALNLCEGKITHVRHTRERTGESILDFFVVCDLILPLVSKMTIYSRGEIALSRYKNRVVNSDHRMLKLEVNLTFHKEKNHERVEVFNVRNKQCQKVFCEVTLKEGMFTKCFKSQEENIFVQFKRWQRIFNKAIHTSFRKI